MAEIIQPGSVPLFERASREKKHALIKEDLNRPIVRLSIEDAMERALASCQHRDLLKQMISDKPGWYGVPRWGSRVGSFHILVDLDEFLKKYEEVVNDDKIILEYLNQFPEGFIKSCLKEAKRDNLDDKVFRTTLIRNFFGLTSDHAALSFAYNCDDEQTREWTRGELLEKYWPHYQSAGYVGKWLLEGKGAGCWSQIKEFSQVDEFANNFKFPLANHKARIHMGVDQGFIQNGIFYSEVQPMGRLRYEVLQDPEIGDDIGFPVGDPEMDLARFNELKRLLTTLKEAPHVNEIWYNPGISTVINVYDKKD